MLNGGASNKEVERLYMKEKGIGRSVSRRGSKGRRDGSRNGRAPSMRSTSPRPAYGPPIEYDPRAVENGNKIVRAPSGRSNASRSGRGAPRPDYGPPIEYDDRVARDGYGPPQGPPEKKWYQRN